MNQILLFTAFVCRHIVTQLFLSEKAAVIKAIGSAHKFVMFNFSPIRNDSEILSESAGMLLDAAPKKEIVEGIKSVAAGVEGVMGLDWLRCRKAGRGLLVDAAVRVGGGMTVRDAHVIGDAVKAAVMDAHPEVFDVLVHINSGD